MNICTYVSVAVHTLPDFGLHGVLGRFGILVCMEKACFLDAYDDNMVWVEKADTLGFIGDGDTNSLDCDFVWAGYSYLAIASYNRYARH